MSGSFRGLRPRISYWESGLPIAVLIIIAVAMTKASQAIQPHRIFFILTWLIYALAFKMLGVSIHALQLTNILPSHLVNGLPTIDWAGIYPSWEVLLPPANLCGSDRPHHGETTWQRVEQMK